MKTTLGLTLEFFALVAIISLPFWWLGQITGIQLLPGIPIGALWILAPSATALWLVHRQAGKQGVVALLKRAFDFGRIEHKGWYLPVVLLMPGMLVVMFWLMRLSGSPIPNPNFSLPSVFVLFLICFSAALSEELGWMGYAFEAMRARWGTLASGLLLGLAWAVFHIVPITQAGRSPEWVAWQCLGLVGTRLVFVWIYEGAGRSVFAIAILHALQNLSWQLFPVHGSFYDPRLNVMIVGAVLGLLVLSQDNRRAFWLHSPR